MKWISVKLIQGLGAFGSGLTKKSGICPVSTEMRFIVIFKPNNGGTQRSLSKNHERQYLATSAAAQQSSYARGFLLA